MTETALDGKYYKREITGLIYIIKSSDEYMISNEYILEKLNMILEGGIGFHAAIEEALKLCEEAGEFNEEIKNEGL